MATSLRVRSASRPNPPDHEEIRRRISTDAEHRPAYLIGG
jgi:hypothetical protein